jgi:hypothetical protein
MQHGLSLPYDLAYSHKKRAQGAVGFRRQMNAPLTFCVKIKGGARQ